MILAAEFPAIPSSAVKIASERRCAILVHSVSHLRKRSAEKLHFYALFGICCISRARKVVETWQCTIGDKVSTCRFFFLGGGGGENIFGNYYRKHYSIILRGEIISVVYGLVLFFLGNHEYIGYSYSFFSRRCVGMSYCNATPLFYRILSF